MRSQNLTKKCFLNVFCNNNPRLVPQFSKKMASKEHNWRFSSVAYMLHHALNGKQHFFNEKFIFMKLNQKCRCFCYKNAKFHFKSFVFKIRRDLLLHKKSISCEIGWNSSWPCSNTEIRHTFHTLKMKNQCKEAACLFLAS
jgi:hypothetical protein